MIHQLRVYKIEPKLKDEFDTRFRNHALRIMKSYGFEPVSMWYSAVGNETEFVYILQWSDVLEMKRRWEAFMSDEEWIEIKNRSRDAYGELVLAKMKDQVLSDTEWFKNKI